MADSLQDLKENLEAEIKNEMGELLDDRNYSDRLREMVDGWIPQDYSTLAKCLENDHSLAEVEDSGLLPENPSVWEIIGMAIYEQLNAYADSTFQELKDEFESDKDDLEIDGLEIDSIPKSGGKCQIIRPNEDDEDAEPEIIHGPFSYEYDAVKWWKEKSV